VLLRIKTWLKRHRLYDRAALLGLAAFVLAVWAFAELADDAPEGDYLVWEHKIMLLGRQADGITPRGEPWLPEIARDITALGSAPVLVLITVVVLAALALQRRFGVAWLVAGAALGGHLLNLGLKALFARARPDVALHLFEETSPSFPSGHSMSASVIYLTLGLLLAQTFTQRRFRVFLIGLAGLLSFLVGLSRVYLGVHYPTDVAAGWSGGIAWALACGLLMHLYRVRQMTERQSLV